MLPSRGAVFQLSAHQSSCPYPFPPLLRIGNNAFMAEQALAIRNRMKAFRRTQLRHSSRLARSREEHEAILNAIAQGEGDEASRRMRAHMLNAASAIGRYISMQTKKDL